MKRSCPWCGPEAAIELTNLPEKSVRRMTLEVLSDVNAVFYAFCEICGAQGPSAKNKAEALRFWNRRFGDGGALKIPGRER